MQKQKKGSKNIFFLLIIVILNIFTIFIQIRSVGADIIFSVYPEAIEIEPTSNKIYVVDGNNENLLVIDGETNLVKNRIQTGNQGSFDIEVDYTADKIYLSGVEGISIIDIKTERKICQIGFDKPITTLALGNGNGKLYALSPWGECGAGERGIVFVIDTVSMKKVANVSLGLSEYEYAEDMIINKNTNEVYVLTNPNGTIYSIDGNKYVIDSKISAGGLASKIVLDSKKNRIFVIPDRAGTLQGYAMLVLDLNNQTFIDTPGPALFKEPFVYPYLFDYVYALAIEENTGTLYFVAAGELVQIVDGETGFVKGIIPYGSGEPEIKNVALNSISHRFYIIDRRESALIVIDLAENRLIGKIPLEFNSLNHIETNGFVVKCLPIVSNIGQNREDIRKGSALGINWKTNKLYIADSHVQMVSVVDCNTLSLIGSIDIETDAYALSVDVDNNRVYVATSKGVLVIDGRTETIVATISADYGEPFDMAFNPMDGAIYVTSGSPREGVIWIFDSKTNSVVGNVPCLAFSSNSIEVNSINSKVYAETASDGLAPLIVESQMAVYGQFPGFLTTYRIGDIYSGGLSPAIAIYKRVNDSLLRTEVMPALSPELGKKIIIAFDSSLNVLYENAEVWYRVDEYNSIRSSGFILVVNGESNVIERSFDLTGVWAYDDLVVGNNSTLYALTGMYSWAYSAQRVDSSLIKFDGKTGKVIDKIFLTPQTRKVAVNPTNDIVYAYDARMGVLLAIEPVPKTQPVAYFSYEQKDSLQVSFNASLSYDLDGGTISSYNWDFADGSIGSGKIVEHIYSGTGSYSVKLTVIDDEGEKTSEEIIVKVTGENHPPVLLGFTSASSVKPNATLEVVANVSDIDEDDLIFTWTCDYGCISFFGDKLTWKAPKYYGYYYYIKLIVDDGHGGTCEGILPVIVQKNKFFLSVKSSFGNPRGEGEYEEGSLATVSVDDRGFLIFVFDGWKGDSDSQSSTISIIMDSPKVVEAKWKIDLMALTILIALFGVFLYLWIRSR